MKTILISDDLHKRLKIAAADNSVKKISDLGEVALSAGLKPYERLELKK